MAVAAAKKKQIASKKAKGGSALQMMDSIQAMMDNVREQVGKRVDGSKARMRTAELAVRLIKLQRSLFDRAFKILKRVNDRSDKMIKDHLDDASWLPAEGKEIVREWSRAVNDGRDEFQKTVDKSYDLLRTYFERLKKEQKASGKKQPAMETKRKPARRRTAARPKTPPEMTQASM